ncbi:MAG: DUF4416 family protein [Candidatus Omnitrophota bacterium]
MGILVKQKPVKLAVSIIFKDEDCRWRAEECLVKKYGKVEPVNTILPFDFTDYYSEEFGEPLKRQLMCFKRLVDNEKIYKIKLETNKIEDSFKKNGKRVVNIDPGYVTKAKLVLLSTKDYSHRVYIGGKIFAEITLFFQGGTFKSHPWTYPDYASQEIVSYFNKVRAIYRDEIKNNHVY